MMGMNLTTLKLRNLSLMVYLYFARKAFCLLKPLWGGDMAWISGGQHGHRVGYIPQGMWTA